MDYEKTIPERYRATYDSKKDVWLVLDSWHPQIKNMADLSDEIPDDSPALKIIPGSEMNAIMGAMIKMGWIEKFHGRKVIKDNPKSNIIKYKSKSHFKKSQYNIEKIVREVIHRIELEDKIRESQEEDYDYRRNRGHR